MDSTSQPDMAMGRRPRIRVRYAVIRVYPHYLCSRAFSIISVNLGGLFVLEPFISPALFQAYDGVSDEWTLSVALSSLPSGNNLTSVRF